MKIGLMQPYLFPYLGYFQLINAVDEFVIHNDIQFIKNGWINRNRVLVNGEAQYITMPLKKASSYANINEREFSDDMPKQVKTILRKIENLYRRAPHFEEAFAAVSKAMSSEDRNVNEFVVHSIKCICEYLGITTPISQTSDMDIPEGLKGQDRVLNINKQLSSTHYINPIGGTELYDKAVFAENGMELSFIKMNDVVYPQFKNEFVPALSIVDVMMFNSKEEIKNLLEEYTLV